MGKQVDIVHLSAKKVGKSNNIIWLAVVLCYSSKFLWISLDKIYQLGNSSFGWMKIKEKKCRIKQ